MQTINLGILAHVDAGKTSLTERLLFETGAIRQLGSVDTGTTQTDTLALERQRGITIKSAVAALRIDDLMVHLLDTPGHPDFIAEVERVLDVLDGVILVISAVEGVQAQTRVLMRALQRLRVPTLLFINKIDRRNADVARVCEQIARTLTPAIIPLQTVEAQGTPQAIVRNRAFDSPPFQAELLDLLTRHNDLMLERYVQQATIDAAYLQAELVRQCHQQQVFPVLYGSAITGAGIDELLAAVKLLLPQTVNDPQAPVAGRIFKIDWDAAGQKVAYVRVLGGVIHRRQLLPVGGRAPERVVALEVIREGGWQPCRHLEAGQIGKIWGLYHAQIGDTIGSTSGLRQRQFALPSLEAIITPQNPEERNALHRALVRLAESDPLINVRLDPLQQELYISLYGEVQKEVIRDTLAYEFGIAVTFSEMSVICVERPIGSGAAVEWLGKDGNPFLATFGVRVEAAPPNAGLQVVFDLEREGIPLYVYKSVEGFQEALTQIIHEVFQQGLSGWHVTDCCVTVTHAGYSAPATTARDFRLLAPLVLMEALAQAETQVCEPWYCYEIDAPADSLSTLLGILARVESFPNEQRIDGERCWLSGSIPAVLVHQVQLQIANATHGEGVWEYRFQQYRPVRGEAPTRARSDANPLNRREYLSHLSRRF
jgi:ribosomal protection tetracycline resistance protein